MYEGASEYFPFFGNQHDDLYRMCEVDFVLDFDVLVPDHFQNIFTENVDVGLAVFGDVLSGVGDDVGGGCLFEVGFCVAGDKGFDC